MLFYVILAFLFACFLFYTKFVKIFVFEDIEIFQDTVVDKKEIPYTIARYNPDFSPHHYIYDAYFYFIEFKNYKTLVPVTFYQYSQISPKQNIALIKKTSYYIKRTGWFFKNSDLVIEEDVKLGEIQNEKRN